MELHFKAFVIFLIILFLILLCGLFPSAAMLGIALAIGSVIIVYQTILILKDKEQLEK